MIVCETARLRLRHLLDCDAPFILELLNEPDFIRNIGDREVRTLEDARRYIQHGPMVSYSQHGFGLWLVELRDGGAPIGICGLLKRDYLQDVDVGFALREALSRQGLCVRSRRGGDAHGTEDLGISRIVAITSPDNQASSECPAQTGARIRAHHPHPGPVTRHAPVHADGTKLARSQGKPRGGVTR